MTDFAVLTTMLKRVWPKPISSEIKAGTTSVGSNPTQSGSGLLREDSKTRASKSSRRWLATTGSASKPTRETSSKKTGSITQPKNKGELSFVASIDKVKNKIEETQKLLKEEEKAFSEGSDFLVEKRKEHQKLNKEKQQIQADLEMKAAEFNTAAQAIQKQSVAQSHHQQNIDLYKLDIKTQTR